MKSIWILTEEYNDYDQHGEYFLAAFKEKPSLEELKKYDYDHIGRVHNEYSWCNLEEIVLK